ncbi:flap endonuclease gen 1 [Fusarium langsethiae]|uniref:Flap endonuclease gen 1 n=1 Tax=Fusarium langsethiae TaxID=179993 RepID=A0A0M9ELI1_FUSLA|nr:flap endonuclease gen 1 [Fusarium langsethiae]
MGIKGIHQEIGGGERIALLKLAAQSIEQQGRPLRIAIDVAIWQFQNQAAQGGTNPEIRTLFYRLARLLTCPVEPIFVFDGPYKPTIKRNKQSSRGSSFANAQAKHPTHVSLLDAKKLELGSQGLDREGMVLVALMSGGDYNPDGLPGCGIKVALEAARAGFGNELCRLKSADKEAIQSWRASLIHELRTNEKGYFKRRNQALKIPETFPDFKILRYYTHPVVSRVESLGQIREKVHMKREIQIEDLREFTREVFGWDYRVGALKFVKTLSRSVFVQKLQAAGGYDHEGLIKGVTGFKKDINHDSVSLARLQHIPIDMVPIDMSKEEDEQILQARAGLALNSDDDIEDADNIEASVSKTVERPFDPARPMGVWVIEALAKKSEPFAIQESAINTKIRASEHRKANQQATKKSNALSKTGMTAGALNKFVRATKPHAASTITSKTGAAEKDIATSPARKTTSRRLRIPSPLESSKQPVSTSESPTRQTATPWSLASSQVTPRNRSSTDGKQQAIVITSSPPCAAESPPPSPSPPARTRISTSQPNQVEANLYGHVHQKVQDPKRLATSSDKNSILASQTKTQIAANP